MRKLNKLLFVYLLTTALFTNSFVIVSTQTVNKSSFAQGQKQAEMIKADWLRNYLKYIASDEREGRDTPSQGLDLTIILILTWIL